MNRYSEEIFSMLEPNGIYFGHAGFSYEAWESNSDYQQQMQSFTEGCNVGMYARKGKNGELSWLFNG